MDEHLVKCYRTYILGCKRKFGTARNQVHYLDIVQGYLEAKRRVIASKPQCFGYGSERITNCNCKGIFNEAA